MAKSEKHKTKYKESSIKDFKKSQKAEIRKDIKDYTHDDKDGGLNPNSTKEAQLNVLRKRDKQVIDNVENMVPNKKDVADYYKVQGDHDPKYTAKERAKLQDEDEKTSKDQIKDKIENLTREQKERLVREYIRRKIKKVLAEKKNAKPDYLDFDEDGDKEEPMKKALKDKEAKNEQDEPDPEETPAEEPAEEPADTEAGAEAPEADAGEETTDTPAGGAAAASPSPSPSPTAPPAEPEAKDDVAAAEDSAESDEQETEDALLDDTLSKEQKRKKAIMKQSLVFQKSDTGRTSADALKPIIDLGIDNLDEEGKKSFYLTLKKLADKNLSA